MAVSEWLQHARARVRIRNRGHLGYYAGVVDRAARRDPRAAIGGLWEELGTLQFEFLRARGLEPHHRLLDIGCGSLRGGVHFVRYLEAGRYTGIDISAEVLRAGQDLLDREGLDDKGARLIHVTDNSFSELAGERFDFLLAQSVLSHLPVAAIGDLFTNVTRVMEPHSRWYATFRMADKPTHTPDRTAFNYPFATLRKLGADRGLEVRMLTPEHYPHPRGQRMLEMALGS